MRMDTSFVICNRKTFDFSYNIKKNQPNRAFGETLFCMTSINIMK